MIEDDWNGEFGLGSENTLIDGRPSALQHPVMGF